MFNNFRQPHLPQTHVGGRSFSRTTMSKMKELSIDESNDLIEIASKVEDIKSKLDEFKSKYDRFRVSNDISFSQLEETTGCRLNVNVGIVSFLEMSSKQLIVQFR